MVSAGADKEHGEAGPRHWTGLQRRAGRLVGEPRPGRGEGGLAGTWARGPRAEGMARVKAHGEGTCGFPRSSRDIRCLDQRRRERVGGWPRDRKVTESGPRVPFRPLPLVSFLVKWGSTRGLT